MAYRFGGTTRTKLTSWMQITNSAHKLAAQLTLERASESRSRASQPTRQLMMSLARLQAHCLAPAERLGQLDRLA